MNLKYILLALVMVTVLYQVVVTFSVHTATIGFADLLNRERPVATKRIAYGTEPSQFGELWLPEGKGPHRVMVMIHGGCWHAALPGVELMAYIAEDMRRHGIAVWNIEYRRLGHYGGGYPGTFLDIANGVDYLRSISTSYNLDLSHVVMIGHSAGGQLALWAAARKRLGSDGILYRVNPLPVSKVVTLAGINDLADYRKEGPDACGGPATIDSLIDAKGRQGTNPYEDTSPAEMLPIGVPQVIVSGSQDPIVPAQFGSNYGNKAKLAGDQAEILTISGAGHFELIDPTSEAWVQIRNLITKNQ